MDILTTHVNADFDCLGSLVAAQLLYPQAVTVFAGACEPAVQDYLRRHNDCGLRLKRWREIDPAAVRRLILVDVNSTERIGPLAALLQQPQVRLHLYDHHPPEANLPTAERARVERVGATVTLLSDELRQHQLTPSAEQATVMMLGLYEDTGNLLFPSTTTADYEAAAFLLDCGANLNQVADALNRELSALQVEVLHQLLQSLQLVSVAGVEISLAQAAVERYVGDLAVLAHKLRDMENLDALIIAVRLEDRVFLVGRSRLPGVDVGQVMGQFGGGGHPAAASATVRDLTLVQVMETLPQVLARLVRPNWTAAQLMTTPVRQVGAEQSLNEAAELLSRYHINALVVCDGAGGLVGLLTRQTVERAVHHGLASVAVAEYMSREFGQVTPQTPLEQVQQIIIDQRQRFVPVVESGRAVGVVTRTDLLRHLVARGRSLRPDAPIDGIQRDRRHVLRLLETRLPRRIRQLLDDLAQVAEVQGVNIYAVGGFVRDLLLGVANLDVDVVVEGNAIAFAEALQRQCDCRVRPHEKFVTAVVIFPDGYKLDLASTRTEYYLQPGALPLVEQASLKLDLYRRDFTINTLALALNGPRQGELTDYFGAQRDLHDKALRVLHNLSFVEDPTRMLRAVRFEQRLGFTLGQHTAHLLRSAVQMGFLQRVSASRVLHELVLLLGEPQPGRALARLVELGLLDAISEELRFDDSLQQHFVQAGRAINWYELLPEVSPLEHWPVYFLCLLADLKTTAVERLCQRLGMPQRYRRLFVEQRHEAWPQYHQLERLGQRVEQLCGSELARLLDGLPVELLLLGMARTRHQPVRLAFSRYVTGLRCLRPMLDGRDLQRLGCPAGPLLGTLLRRLRDARLDGQVHTREEELAWVRVQLATRELTEEER
ncbi:MAG: CBS domain-containing protein [Desulfuromonas thiophila]|nr:CBS domain-containing protein [Desulfuromonas thiophila]